MGSFPVQALGTSVREMDLGGAKVHEIPGWNSFADTEKLRVIRQIALARGQDPRIAKLAVSIVKKAGAQPREYKKQAAALLKWVQKNIYYVNEPGERLQDPIYTLKVKFADCDDAAILLGSMFHAISLPWRLVISGRRKNGDKGKVRYIEGNGHPEDDVNWTHIYCIVGNHPFAPTEWYFCEPTVSTVPLGWDVIAGDERFLPEMIKREKGAVKPKIMPSPRAKSQYKGSIPRQGKRSPAYALAYNQEESFGSIGSSVGSSIAEQAEDTNGLTLNKIMPAVATGVAVSVLTSIALDWIRGDGMWKDKGSAPERLRVYFARGHK